MVTLAALEPYEATGRPANYLDLTAGRWVKLLSTTPPDTRLYLYLLRRPAGGAEFPAGYAGDGPRAELARRALAERRDFLAPRLPVSTL